MTVADPPDATALTRDPVAAYLGPLVAAGRAVGDVPLLGCDQWVAMERTDPRSTASIARAALAWYADGRPDAIEARLLDELAVADLLARWRIRAAGLDVHAVMDDWPRVFDVVQARRGGYRAVA